MGKWITSKVYPIEYLIENDLTEEDLKNLFDRSSLFLSLILNEFRIIGDTREDWVIIKEAKTIDNWQDNYTFNKKQREKFLSNVTKVLINMYQHSEFTCRRNAENFLFKYGFRVKS